jgi:hypothetical protein
MDFVGPHPQRPRKDSIPFLYFLRFQLIKAASLPTNYQQGEFHISFPSPNSTNIWLQYSWSFQRSKSMIIRLPCCVCVCVCFCVCVCACERVCVPISISEAHPLLRNLLPVAESNQKRRNFEFPNSVTTTLMLRQVYVGRYGMHDSSIIIE